MEEAEERPNKRTCIAMELMAIIVMMILLLNEIGVFQVDRMQMRISLLTGIVLLLIPPLMMHSNKLMSKPWMKGVIIGCVILATVMTSVLLNFHVVLIQILPMLISAQYPSKKAGMLAFAGSVFCAIFAPVFSYLMGFWHYDLFRYLMATGFPVAKELPVLSPTIDITELPGILTNIVLPNLLIVCAFYFITRSVNRSSADRLEKQLQVLHMSQFDALTELKNRHSFIQAEDFFPKQCQKSLACVYIDANGLHRINNDFGHSAGDSFLILVAQTMRECFGEEYTYRIGGDEFTVLVADMDHAEIQTRVSMMVKLIENQGYSISVGVEYASAPCSMQPVVNAAEAKMQDAKQQYYRQKKADR